MSVRIAKPEDLKKIVEIYNQAISAGQRTADTMPMSIEDRLQWFEEHTPDKYPILIEEKDSLVIGYLTISAYRPGRAALRHTAEVSFYVHFDHHRQGVASRLLQHAIDLCPSLQIKSLFAILMESNTASIQQLKKFGFEQWAHLPRVADYDGVEVGQLYYGLRVE
jgi:L-amino acid N-acyltransferase YncA